MSLGFGFHSSKKWQAARTAASGWLIFAVVVSFAEPQKRSFSEIFEQTPAMIFAAAIFLGFSLFLSMNLVRVMRKRFALEFTSTQIIDHRQFRLRSVLIKDIEIFSPKPEAIFSPEPKIQKIRESFGVKDHIDIACRVRGEGPDFIFSGQVAMPTPSDQARIVSFLKEKIAVFDNLYSDLGDDVGGDASDFDETQS